MHSSASRPTPRQQQGLGRRRLGRRYRCLAAALLLAVLSASALRAPRGLAFAAAQQRSVEAGSSSRPRTGEGRGDRRGAAAAIGREAAQRDGAGRSDFYEVLGLPRSASRDEIKKAFRALALRHHPDVSAAPGAAALFREAADAYEALSDAASRAAYDAGGHAALEKGAYGARGAADLFWDEFKPTKRAGASRKHAAREAAAASGGEDMGIVVGALVEYPLRAHDASPGRTHGVGLLVARNGERGDAAKLPADQLSMCEIEPLWQPEDEDCSAQGCWLVDDLEPSAFAHEHALRPLRAEYVRGRGVAAAEHWFVRDLLSERAGSPDGAAGEMVAPLEWPKSPGPAAGAVEALPLERQGRSHDATGEASRRAATLRSLSQHLGPAAARLRPLVAQCGP